jgi:predicted metal-dependent peptidase
MMHEKIVEARKREEDTEYIREKVLRKFPLLGVIMSHLKIVARGNLRDIDGKPLDTATTDGETIYYHPEFFSSLSDSEKIFILAHEILHIAFNHILRSKDRDQNLWGMATDAVINQILKSEGLPLVKGSIDREDAINRSAEEVYGALFKDAEEDKLKEVKSDWIVNYSESQEADRGRHNIWNDAIKQAEQKNSFGSEK